MSCRVVWCCGGGCQVHEPIVLCRVALHGVVVAVVSYTDHVVLSRVALCGDLVAVVKYLNRVVVMGCH